MRLPRLAKASLISSPLRGEDEGGGEGSTRSLTMLKIKKEYIVNSNNKKAVLMDIETFEKLEELLENYGLGKYMEEVK